MDELKTFQITFKPIHLVAVSPEVAEQKAQELISSGEIEIKDVYEI